MKSRVCCRCHRLVSRQCDCKKEVAVNSNAKGYGSRWRRFRERLLKHRLRTGVLCAMCGLAFGDESPHADHKIPVLSEDDPLFYEPNNIQFLHVACHAVKTARDVKAGTTR